jgi:hypothetical protein
MYHYLSAHPEFYPAGRKELHYWTFRFSIKPGKVSKYLANFSAAAKRYQHVSIEVPFARSPIVTGEATPDLHYYPIAPMRLKTLLPNARFVLIKRPAFELAFSIYNYNRGKLQSPKNADRFAPLDAVARFLGLFYATPIVEEVAQAASDDKSFGKGIRLSSAGLFKHLNFDNWVSLFALEIESCLACRSKNASSRISFACSKIPALQAKFPTLYRHHEDVVLYGESDSDLLDFGGRLPRLEQCWFPPTTHHLNFFARSAYKRQVALWRRFFSSNNGDQLLEVDSVSFFAKPTEVLSRVASFLGLSPFEFPSGTLGVKLQGPPRFLPKVDVHNLIVPSGGGERVVTAETVSKATASGKQKAATDHSSASEFSRVRFVELSRRLENAATNAMH